MLGCHLLAGFLLVQLGCSAGLKDHRCDRFRDLNSLNLNFDDPAALALETRARIVGGTIAEDREHPWTISVRRQSSCRHFCGGTLIHSRWAITAAHCVWKRLPWELFVVAGGQSTRRTPGDQSIAIRRIFPHPDYNYCKRNFAGDIALLYLDQKVQVVSQFARLPSAASLSVPLAEGTVEVVGLGRLVSKGPTAYKRHKAVLTVLPPEDCHRIYRKPKDQMFCAGRAGQDTCQGDSGAGATHKDTILGVVSHGVGCGRFPGVYTDVRYFVDWVSATVRRVDGEETAAITNGDGARKLSRAGKEQEVKTLIKRLFQCHGVRIG
jgi:secreted trypsin-like serine protease